jgi:hypothetical protein
METIVRSDPDLDLDLAPLPEFLAGEEIADLFAQHPQITPRRGRGWRTYAHDARTEACAVGILSYAVDGAPASCSKGTTWGLLAACERTDLRLRAWLSGVACGFDGIRRVTRDELGTESPLLALYDSYLLGYEAGARCAALVLPE